MAERRQEQVVSITLSDKGDNFLHLDTNVMVPFTRYSLENNGVTLKLYGKTDILVATIKTKVLTPNAHDKIFISKGVN